MVNVPIMHCFPSIDQEYVWEVIGNYIVLKTDIHGAQHNI